EAGRSRSPWSGLLSNNSVYHRAVDSIRKEIRNHPQASQRKRVMPETTALYETTSQAGAVFAEEFGWLLPAHYGNATAEYEYARQQAALFDLSHHGQVDVSGPDAASFLHNLCTNEVKNLLPGRGCEAFLTTGQAKIVAFITVYRAILPPD